MKPYVLKFIPNEDVELFEKIRNSVNLLPVLDLGRDSYDLPVILSCHILARAVANVFSLSFVDGYFYSNAQHSWVLTPNENIIDVYPVGVFGGPILIHGEQFCPSSWLYRQDPRMKPAFQQFDDPCFIRAIETVSSHLTR